MEQSHNPLSHPPPTSSLSPSSTLSASSCPTMSLTTCPASLLYDLVADKARGPAVPSAWCQHFPLIQSQSCCVTDGIGDQKQRPCFKKWVELWDNRAPWHGSRALLTLYLAPFSPQVVFFFFLSFFRLFDEVIWTEKRLLIRSSWAKRIRPLSATDDTYTRGHTPSHTFPQIHVYIWAVCKPFTHSLTQSFNNSLT